MPKVPLYSPVYNRPMTLAPKMKNQRELNEEKPCKEKNDLSIELSEVTHVVSLDTNNLSIRV
jgi:hypothetical protein